MSAQPVAEESGYTWVCKVGDLAPGTAAQAEVDGVIVAMVRDSGGGIHALDDRCTHADVSLSEGEVDGCTLECWLHGSRFDVRTGNPSGPPATVPVAIYPVKINGDDVFVNTRGDFATPRAPLSTHLAEPDATARAPLSTRLAEPDPKAAN